MSFNLYLILFIILGFWGIMNYLSPSLKDRGVEVAGFTLLWRTKKFMGVIDNLSKKFGKFWDYFAKFGIIASLFGSVFVIYLLGSSILKMMESPEAPAGVMLAIPGVTIPLWYGLIGIVTLVIVHEFAHGIVARRENIPLKSVGAGVFIALPLAFVEPEEEEMKKASPWARIKVYGAGSTANFVLALVALLLIFSIFTPQLPNSGVVILDTEPDSPAELAGLETGMLIEELELKGVVYNIDNYKQFEKLMEETTPGEILIMITQKGKYTINLAKHPEKNIGYIGIRSIDRSWVIPPPVSEIIKNPGKLKDLLYSLRYLSPILYPETFSTAGWFFINSLIWIFILNLGIGLMNLLPIPYVLDGGKIVKELIEMKFSKKVSNAISVSLTIMCLILLLINFFPKILVIL